MTLPTAYSNLVALTSDLEPAHTAWRASELPILTLEQITLIRDARPVEFCDKFAKADLDGSGLLDALTMAPIVLQAKILAAVEWAARQVLFDDAVDEGARREELDALEDGFGDKADAARQEAL